MSKSWEICIEFSWKGTTIFKMLRLQILIDISCYKIWKWIDSQVGLDLLDLNNDQLWVLGQVMYIDRDPVTLVIGITATCIPGSPLLWPMSWTLGWSFHCDGSLPLNVVSLFHYPCIPLNQKMCEGETMCIFIFVLPEYKYYSHKFDNSFKLQFLHPSNGNTTDFFKRVILNTKPARHIVSTQ